MAYDCCVLLYQCQQFVQVYIGIPLLCTVISVPAVCSGAHWHTTVVHCYISASSLFRCTLAYDCCALLYQCQQFVQVYIGIRLLCTVISVPAVCSGVHWHTTVVHCYISASSLFRCTLAYDCCALLYQCQQFVQVHIGIRLLCTVISVPAVCSGAHWHTTVVHCYISASSLFRCTLAYDCCALLYQCQQFVQVHIGIRLLCTVISVPAVCSGAHWHTTVVHCYISANSLFRCTLAYDCCALLYQCQQFVQVHIGIPLLCTVISVPTVCSGAHWHTTVVHCYISASSLFRCTLAYHCCALLYQCQQFVQVHIGIRLLCTVISVPAVCSGAHWHTTVVYCYVSASSLFRCTLAYDCCALLYQCQQFVQVYIGIPLLCTVISVPAVCSGAHWHTTVVHCYISASSLFRCTLAYDCCALLCQCQQFVQVYIGIRLLCAVISVPAVCSGAHWHTTVVHCYISANSLFRCTLAYHCCALLYQCQQFVQVHIGIRLLCTVISVPAVCSGAHWHTTVVHCYVSANSLFRCTLAYDCCVLLYQCQQFVQVHIGIRLLCTVISVPAVCSGAHWHTTVVYCYVSASSLFRCTLAYDCCVLLCQCQQFVQVHIGIRLLCTVMSVPAVCSGAHWHTTVVHWYISASSLFRCTLAYDCCVLLCHCQQFVQVHIGIRLLCTVMSVPAVCSGEQWHTTVVYCYVSASSLFRCTLAYDCCVLLCQCQQFVQVHIGIRLLCTVMSVPAVCSGAHWHTTVVHCYVSASSLFSDDHWAHANETRIDRIRLLLHELSCYGISRETGRKRGRCSER